MYELSWMWKVLWQTAKQVSRVGLVVDERKIDQVVDELSKSGSTTGGQMVW